ncbi:unnamed protein product, partial [Trichogramma brassicae]
DCSEGSVGVPFARAQQSYNTYRAYISYLHLPKQSVQKDAYRALRVDAALRTHASALEAILRDICISVTYDTSSIESKPRASFPPFSNGIIIVERESRPPRKYVRACARKLTILTHMIALAARRDARCSPRKEKKLSRPSHRLNSLPVLSTMHEVIEPFTNAWSNKVTIASRRYYVTFYYCMGPICSRIYDIYFILELVWYIFRGSYNGVARSRCAAPRKSNERGDSDERRRARAYKTYRRFSHITQARATLAIAFEYQLGRVDHICICAPYIHRLGWTNGKGARTLCTSRKSSPIQHQLYNDTEQESERVDVLRRITMTISSGYSQERAARSNGLANSRRAKEVREFTNTSTVAVQPWLLFRSMVKMIEAKDTLDEDDSDDGPHTRHGQVFEEGLKHIHTLATSEDSSNRCSSSSDTATKRRLWSVAAAESFRASTTAEWIDAREVSRLAPSEDAAADEELKAQAAALDAEAAAAEEGLAVVTGSLSSSAGRHEAVKVASSLGLQGPAAPIGAQLLQATGGAAAAIASGSGGDHHPAASSATEHATTVYHANLLAGSSGTVQAALQQPAAAQALLASLGSAGVNPAATAAALASMQASAETSALDLQTMQSMEWLFKKERIYLLAQFWQQICLWCSRKYTRLKVTRLHTDAHGRHCDTIERYVLRTARRLVWTRSEREICQVPQSRRQSVDTYTCARAAHLESTRSARRLMSIPHISDVCAHAHAAQPPQEREREHMERSSTLSSSNKNAYTSRSKMQLIGESYAYTYALLSCDSSSSSSSSSNEIFGRARGRRRERAAWPPEGDLHLWRGPSPKF